MLCGDFLLRYAYFFSVTLISVIEFHSFIEFPKPLKRIYLAEAPSKSYSSYDTVRPDESVFKIFV